MEYTELHPEAARRRRDEKRRTKQKAAGERRGIPVMREAPERGIQ
jgi:hypothetical protein